MHFYACRCLCGRCWALGRPRWAVRDLSYETLSKQEGAARKNEKQTVMLSAARKTNDCLVIQFRIHLCCAQQFVIFATRTDDDDRLYVRCNTLIIIEDGATVVASVVASLPPSLRRPVAISRSLILHPKLSSFKRDGPNP